MAKTHFISNKFIKSLQSLIPYKELELTPDIDELNPNYKAFNDTGVRRTDVLLNHSILYGQDRNDVLQGYVNGYNSNTTYANIQPDKAARIRDYRVMAAYSEVANALDEICDELINVDIDGNIFKLDIIESDKITPQMSKTLEEEFKKFIQIFNFEDEGWNLGRKLLTEGEVYYEHIISEEHPELGILGVLPLPSELIDPTYDNVQNYNIKGYILQKPKLDPNDPTKVEKIEYVPIDKNQVTYINSGIWNQDKTYRLPFIENARKAYRQLTLIEDSIVIYRLARAPERLVFKVDVGNMSTPDAEAYVKKLMHQFWSKKTFDVDQNGLYTKFDPQSMLDDFWFPIRTGSTGTTVEKLQGGCLAMDTKVPLLDGRELTISEIANEMSSNTDKKLYVYSTNPENGHIVPGLITWAGVTQKSAKVMKITFDNNESVICTLDHKYPILGKGFVEAQDLQIGQSMIPLYRQFKSINANSHDSLTYEQIFQNDTKQWEYTHRAVANYIDHDKKQVFNYDSRFENEPLSIIHHKDFNRYNNSPDNLYWMNAKDHFKYHADHGFKYRFELLKETDPELYKQIIQKRTQKRLDTYANWSDEHKQQFKQNCSKAAKQYIASLSDEEREIRNNISKQNRMIGVNHLHNKLNSDSELKHQHYQKVSDGIRNMFANMSDEEHKKFIQKRTESARKSDKCRQKYINNAKTQSLIFDDEIKSIILDNAYTYKRLNDFVDELNSNEQLLLHFNKLNKTQIIRNQIRGQYVFKLQHIKMVIRGAGYANVKHYKDTYKFHNHKIIAIEYLDDPIEVGTLTIDAEEQYHDYHTFALSCGVFTKNSNLDQLQDLLYFQKKLYEALKVPTNRLNKESTQQVSPQELLKEELKFANFIVRIQRGISNSIKSTFITHLQLRGIWDKLKIKEQYFRLKMNVPTNFYDLRESQRMELKMKNFGDAIQTQQISPSLAAKKYLGWTDEMIKANREWLRKDKAFEWELAQITNAGPEWRTAQAVAAGGIEGAAGGGVGGAGPVGDLGGLAGGAPEGFGGAAAPEAGGEADTGGGETQPTIPDNM